MVLKCVVRELRQNTGFDKGPLSVCMRREPALWTMVLLVKMEVGIIDILMLVQFL
jgi:hypothetical protein